MLIGLSSFIVKLSNSRLNSVLHIINEWQDSFKNSALENDDPLALLPALPQSLCSFGAPHACGARGGNNANALKDKDKDKDPKRPFRIRNIRVTGLDKGRSTFVVVGHAAVTLCV